MHPELAPFVGTWLLMSQRTHFPDGRIEPSRGDTPRGMLVYDAAGNMSVQLMRTDQDAGRFHDLRDVETALDGYLGYFGRYTVDAAGGVVTHHVMGASYPDYIGATLKRLFALEGDMLTLRAAAEDGSSRVLVWRRVG